MEDDPGRPGPSAEAGCADPGESPQRREPGGESAPELIVGVGASAGGLEAVSELLRNLPANTGIAFVLVQHLDPHHESILADLLGNCTRMPVNQVLGDVPVRPDHVYVIPPNSTMVIVEGVLRVSRPLQDLSYQRRPIDAFLISLAENMRDRAIGVILSGAASDGTRGLKAIKAEGGITFAQNDTAKFDGMPRSAIAAGVVDFVLPPREIANQLAALARHPTSRPAAEQLSGDQAAMEGILEMIRQRAGVDFRLYKQATIQRRLARRMAVQKAETLPDYLDVLHRDPGEIDALFDDLLIKVTEFFRDASEFEALKTEVFPSLIRDRSEGQPIRIWIPGCSTGEEVYSIAICLLEYLEAAGLSHSVLMFGTDASERVIERARAGLFDENAISTVSPERLGRFFTRSGSGYQINRNVRDRCVFSRHVLGVDPPLSRMDLISCRNLLIYFSPALQQRAIDTLAYAVRPVRYLLVGRSENTGRLSEFFEPVDAEHRIYARRPGGAAPALTVAGELAGWQEPKGSLPLKPSPEAHAIRGTVHAFVDRMLMTRYGPSGVVVDKALRIIEFRGNMNPYLRIREGDAKLDLLDSIREDLSAHLQAAISEAHQQSATVRLDDIQVRRDAAFRFVRITIIPVSLAPDDLHTVILFEDLSGSGGSIGQRVGSSAAAETKPSELETPGRHIEHLERELVSTREYLQSTIEELRSTNEEAQSANEELQSNNEELQTTKEEIQASNEELNTMNAEIQIRNVELGALNDDMVNLLGSISAPIVMVGNDLCIRKFTPAAEKLFRLRPIDVGRPVSDFKPRIAVPNLDEILSDVLETLKVHEQEVEDFEGRGYLLSIRPYRTVGNRIDGAVLLLTDITDLKRGRDEIRRARDYTGAIVDTVREPLLVLDEKLAVRSANRSFYEFFRSGPQQTEGRGVYEIVGRQLDLPPVRELLGRLVGESHLREVEIEHEFRPAGCRTLLVNARRLMADGLVLIAFEDITERKRVAEARYRRLFESARDGIVIVDEGSGEILDVNPYAEQLFGYGRQELVGRRLWEIEAARDTPGLRAALEQTRDLHATRFEMSFKTKNGPAIPTEIIGNTYHEEDRRAIQLNIRDLTERRKFDRELQETQKLESLGLLAGGVAHDFNNLLSGIIVNTDIVSGEMPADNPSRTELRAIKRASEQAAKLTQQLMAYAGKGRFMPEHIHLSELIHDILALIRTSIPKSVDVRLDLAPDLPGLLADAGQVQQLVMNLIINAGEAIGSGNPGIVNVRTSVRELTADEIRASFTSEALTPGSYVCLEVKDTGSGMDEATKAKIFDPFFTTKFTGRGLGLAAVSGILRALHGAIRVYSAPGDGTTFYVLFSALDRAMSPKPAQRAPKPRHGSGTILVIDDEDVIRQAARTALTKTGFEVILAENGQAGADLFKEQSGRISLVILDLTMPVMGGERAFDLLRAIRPDVPILLASGYDETDAVARMANKDFAGFLQKPFDVNRLTEAVAAALGLEND